MLMKSMLHTTSINPCMKLILNVSVLYCTVQYSCHGCLVCKPHVSEQLIHNTRKMGLFGGSSESENYGSKLRPYAGGETLGGEEDSFSSGGAGLGLAGGDFETQVAVEQQKLQFMNQVHKLNEVCWDLCVGNPSSSLSGREETCLTNCVDRFIDTTLLITNRCIHGQ